MASPLSRLYESPANSGGNDGALPSVYDPTWQSYTNLTPSQILAFQAFPQDLVFYVRSRRWMAERSGVTVASVPLTTSEGDQAKVAQLKQAFDTGAVVGTVDFFDANGTVHAVDAAAATAIYRGVVSFVQQTYSTAANLVAGINSKSIATRKQIDAAYAAIAPNSPSATNPSST